MCNKIKFFDYQNLNLLDGDIDLNLLHLDGGGRFSLRKLGSKTYRIQPMSTFEK